MTAITEDYVSFEVAELLKEKGFDEKCSCVWILDKANDPEDTDGVYKVASSCFMEEADIATGSRYVSNKDIDRVLECFDEYCHKDVFLCPTLQTAMRWLREVHQLFIDIRYSVICHRFRYSIWTNESKNYDDGCFVDFIYPTYEQAAEAAIKHCLENYLYRIPDGEKECEFQNHIIQVPDEWQHVRIQAAIAAMQGFLSRQTYRSDLTALAKDSVRLANCLVEELKKK